MIVQQIVLHFAYVCVYDLWHEHVILQFQVVLYIIDLARIELDA
jgi:hypothetical protein